MIVPSEKQILSVDSQGFLELLDMSESGSVLRLCYSANMAEVIKKSVTAVKVTAYLEKDYAQPVTDFSSSDELVDNVLSNHQRVRQAAKANREKLIFSYVSDPTRSIDNSKISQQTGTSPKRVIRSVPLQQATQPLVFSARSVTSPVGTTKSLALGLVFRESVDPAQVTSAQPLVPSQHDLVGGIARVHRPSLLDEYARSLVAASSGLVLSGEALVVEDDVSPWADLFDDVSLDAPLDTWSEFTVCFEALSGGKTPVSRVTKRVKTGALASAFLSPKTAPSVSAGVTTVPGTVRLHIVQRDPNALSVRVYRKLISHAAPASDSAWEKVGDSPLKFGDGAVSLDLDADFASTAVFRVIPIGQKGSLSSEFGSAVIDPSHDIAKLWSGASSGRRPSHASLTHYITIEGIVIDIASLPFDCVSVKLLKRNITSRDVSPEVVSSALVDHSRDFYRFTDSAVTAGTVYEYTTVVVFGDGTEDRQSSTVIEYVPASDDLVSTKVSDLAVTSSNKQLDVSFSLSTSIVPTTLEGVRAALQRQDLLKYFDSEIKDQRTSLAGLISYQVDRVNLTTGTRESFGVLNSTQFVDSELAPINGVEPLRAGCVYRYEVMTLLREPETMLSGYVKTVTTAQNKQFSFKPKKYLHPVTLTRGSLVSDDSIQTNHAKSEFAFGNTGSVTAIEVSMASQQPTVTNVSAGQVGPKTVEVRWKVDGDVSQIDHFVVMKSGISGRKIVGKSHVHQPIPEFFCFHQLDRDDVGTASYTVVPVSTGYDKLPEGISNPITFDTSDSSFRPRSVSVFRDSKSV